MFKIILILSLMGFAGAGAVAGFAYHEHGHHYGWEGGNEHHHASGGAVHGVPAPTAGAALPGLVLLGIGAAWFLRRRRQSA
jgi:hypothetical protein